MTASSPTPAAAEAFLCFAVIDLTTDQTPAEKRPAQALPVMIAAWTEQIEGPFAVAFGLVTIAFRVASGPTDRQPNEIAINFRDTIPEAPGALAYHQVVNGVPDIEIGVDLFDTLTDGSGTNEAVSAGTSHELLELLGDIGANLWSELQDGSGKMVAREECDKVQNTGYQASNGVWVSNFLLPAYWIPGAPGPYDQLGVMSDRSDVSHGYEIQADGPQNETQVGGVKGETRRRTSHVGSLTERQLARKRHPYSRSHRRGLRL